MSNAVIYSTQTCPYCVAAKQLLNSKQIPYEEFDVRADANKMNDMLALSSQRTVPQIVLDGEHIGGYTDLVAHFKRQ